MNNLRRGLYYLALLFLLPFYSFGQENPSVIDVAVLNGTPYSFEIQSVRQPILILPHPELFDSLNVNNIGGGIKKYTYHYTANEVADFHVVVEFYKKGLFPGWDPPKYTTVNIEIFDSDIEASHDYVTIYKNDPPTVIDVLANDNSTHNPISITGYSLSQNGTTEILGDTVLRFTPVPDFTGMAYIQYLVENEYGLNDQGNVSICVLDSTNTAAIDTIRLSTTNKSNITVLLPAAGFSLDPENSPSQGTISFIGDDAAQYKPDDDAEGEDIFLLKTPDDALQRWVIIDVIYVDNDNGYVRDDIVYTSVNTPVSFNVFGNDLKKNSFISSYSNALTYLGSGDFQYSPDEDFEGVKEFYYTCYNGFEYSSAKIYIHVNNFYPENIIHFNLSTPKNTALDLEYEVPIDNFNFNLLSPPLSGTVNIYSGNDTLETNCQVIEGYNMVVYQPDLDFVGTDEFDLEYCIDGTQCTISKIKVEVIEMDSSCFCVGPECVWAGDTDGDGKVNVADLLPIGLYYGSSGNSRDSQDPLAWYGQFSDDWGESLSEFKDIKHIDANGDGLVSDSDVSAVSDHYRLYHSVVPQQSLIIKEYPFDIIPSQTEIDSGDLLFIDISVGSDQYPLTDLHGLAYTLQIASEIIDSSSLEVDFRNDLWFGNDGPTLELYKQPIDGLIETAFTRTNGIPVHGNGIVTTISFIVEDEIDGFKSSSDRIPFEIQISDASYVDALGNKRALPDSKTTVYLDISRDDNNEVLIDDVIVYPNPTKDDVRFHVNGNDLLTEILLFDNFGRLIDKINNIESNDYRMRVDHLPQGIYHVRVTTSKQSITEKIQIYRVD